MSALKGLLFAGGLFILYIFIARWLFVHAGVWLNLVYPLLALATNYTVSYRVSIMSLRSGNVKKIKGVFMHYVAPVVIEAMLKDPGALETGGRRKGPDGPV